MIVIVEGLLFILAAYIVVMIVIKAIELMQGDD
jgi:hypothetical protein